MTDYRKREIEARLKIDTREVMKIALTFCNPDDDGKIGRVTEIVASCFITPLKPKVKISPAGRADVVKYIDGLRNNIEIKTACGSFYGDIETNSAGYYLAKTDWIAYAPQIDINKQVEYQLHVFSREEWEKMVASAKVLRIKYTTAYCRLENALIDIDNATTKKEYQRAEIAAQVAASYYRGNGTVIGIQSFHSDTRPKASKKLEQHIKAWTEKQPTLADWVTANIEK